MTHLSVSAAPASHREGYKRVMELDRVLKKKQSEQERVDVETFPQKVNDKTTEHLRYGAVSMHGIDTVLTCAWVLTAARGGGGRAGQATTGDGAPSPSPGEEAAGTGSAAAGEG